MADWRGEKLKEELSIIGEFQIDDLCSRDMYVICEVCCD